jgi:hypothetical protein
MSDVQQAPRADFEEASSRLEAAVLGACEQCAEWPAKVAAGIYATLDFAVADDAASSCFAIEPPPSGPEGQGRYALRIERFAELLGAAAPERRAISTDRAVIRSVAAMIAEHLRSGRQQRLSAIGPDLVQLVLLPYLSFADAKSWAERTSRSWDS